MLRRIFKTSKIILVSVSRQELVNFSYNLHYWNIDKFKAIFLYLIGFSCFAKYHSQKLTRSSHPIVEIKERMNTRMYMHITTLWLEGL